MGLQEPRQARDGDSRDGSQSQLLEHSQAAGGIEYCRHSNRKTKEGGKHPDRDAQFEYINAKVEEFQADDQPVISTDAKKEELLGEFKNGGSDYSPQMMRWTRSWWGSVPRR
jgi:Rhodopirellula transposase DDE domain